MLSIFEDLFSGNFRHFRGDQYSSPSNLTGYGLAILIHSFLSDLTGLIETS
jgi:hypothetical protein